MPTLLDITGATYPDQFQGQDTPPLPGESILPVLNGKSAEERTLYFEHEGNRAIMNSQWKLTALKGQEWELYDILHDRTELINLSKKNPDIVYRLDSLWSIWANENFVTPLPEDLKVPYLKPLK